MANVRITLDLFGDVQLDRELLRTTERVDDLRPAYRHIARDLRRWEHQLFMTRGRSGGEPWPALLPQTVASKRRSRRPHVRANAERVLIASGRLHDSLTDAGDSEHIEDIDRTTFRFGTRVPYGRFHQRGTRRMRQRRVLALTERQRRDVIRTVQKWLFTGHLG